MVPDLWSNRGESTTFNVVFYPGNMQERLDRGTTSKTGMVYNDIPKVIEISWLLSGEYIIS